MRNRVSGDLDIQVDFSDYQAYAYPTTTTRQQHILESVAAGQSNKEIGARLGLTERTAKFHVTSILNKLGAENRAQAVAIAAQRGLL